MPQGKEKSRADLKPTSANLKSLMANWPDFVQFPKIYREKFNRNNFGLRGLMFLLPTMFWRAPQPKLWRFALNGISLILCQYLYGFSDLVLLSIFLESICIFQTFWRDKKVLLSRILCVTQLVRQIESFQKLKFKSLQGDFK